MVVALVNVCSTTLRPKVTRQPQLSVEMARCSGQECYSERGNIIQVSFMRSEIFMAERDGLYCNPKSVGGGQGRT